MKTLIGTRSATSAKPVEGAKNSRWLRWVAIAAIVVALLIGLRYGNVDLRQIHERFGIGAPIISIPLQAVLAATPFPSDLICIANGAVYGYVWGVLASWLGWFLGSILEFSVLRGAVGTQPVPPESLPAWLRNFPVGSPLFLILGRQIPWGGAHLTIGGAAIAGVSWRRFLWCSAIAIVPGALLMPAIGAKLL